MLIHFVTNFTKERMMMNKYTQEAYALVAIEHFVLEITENFLKCPKECMAVTEFDAENFHSRFATLLENFSEAAYWLGADFEKIGAEASAIQEKYVLKDWIIAAADKHNGMFVAEDIRALRDCFGETEEFGIWQAKLAEDMEGINGADYKYDIDEVIDLLFD